MARDRYDVVIVGGGSAGLRPGEPALGRLRHHVLVLEAGHSDWKIDPFIHMPAALPFPIGSRFYDWRYETDPEPHMNGRRVFHARGKVLGGSSSINGMIFQRGNPMDYERWAAEPGMKEWDYAHCLPYFKRMETCLAGADDWRGGDGPLVLERGPAENPLFEAFFEAAQEAGYPLTDDVNGYRQEGFAPLRPQPAPRPAALRGPRVPPPGAAPQEPRRRDPGDGHPGPVRGQARRRRRLPARRSAAPVRVDAGEVILCGGAINTPQLLQLSGVGDEALLGSLGIDVVRHSPGVGENLQDHLEVYIQYASKQPVSIAPGLRWSKRPGIAYKWLVHRRGLGATNHFEGGGFARTNDDVACPNLMFHFLPVAIRYDGSAADRGPRLPGPRRPDVRRHPRLGADPLDRPARCTRRCSSTTCPRRPTGASGWRRSGWRATSSTSPRSRRTTTASSRPAPRSRPTSRSSTGCAQDAETALHPSCTAAMGVDERSVVDPASMRVHGLEGLRVVDASVFPYVTNGNIYAPVMMVAEKAADLIAGNTPLPTCRRALLPARRRAPAPPARRHPQPRGDSHDRHS